MSDENDIPPIGICWRDDGNGKGAVWDHHTIQRMTGCPTAILAWEKANTKQLLEYLRSESFALPFGDIKVCDPYECRAIVIPGATKVQDEPSRKEFEENILLRYKNRLPILVICAVERLTVLGFEIEAVTDHCASKMMSLGTDGNVLNNQLIHDVHRGDGPIAKKIWPRTSYFPVNSVHSTAISYAPPGEYEIVATSGQVRENQQGKPYLNRQGHEMKPSKCIEAVVSSDPSSPPIVIVQWHPEAFVKECEPHLALMSYALDYICPRRVRADSKPPLRAPASDEKANKPRSLRSSKPPPPSVEEPSTPPRARAPDEKRVRLAEADKCPSKYIGEIVTIVQQAGAGSGGWARVKLSSGDEIKWRSNCWSAV